MRHRITPREQHGATRNSLVDNVVLIPCPRPAVMSRQQVAIQWTQPAAAEGPTWKFALNVNHACCHDGKFFSDLCRLAEELGLASLLRR
jgi:hypothetical protein